MHWHSRISRFPNGQPGKKLPWLPKTQKLCFGARSILGAKTSTMGKGARYSESEIRSSPVFAKGKNASKIFRILIPTFIFMLFCVK